MEDKAQSGRENPFASLDDQSLQLVDELLYADLLISDRFPFTYWNELTELASNANIGAILDVVTRADPAQITQLINTNQDIDTNNLIAYLSQHNNQTVQEQLTQWVESSEQGQFWAWTQDSFTVPNLIASNNVPTSIRKAVLTKLYAADQETIINQVGDFEELTKIYLAVRDNFSCDLGNAYNFLSWIDFSDPEIAEEGNYAIDTSRRTAVGTLIEKLVEDGQFGLAGQIIRGFQARIDNDIEIAEQLQIDLYEIESQYVIEPNLLKLDFSGTHRLDRKKQTNRPQISLEQYDDLDSISPEVCVPIPIAIAYKSLFNRGDYFHDHLLFVLIDLRSKGGQDYVDAFGKFLADQIEKDPRAFLRETTRVNTRVDSSVSKYSDTIYTAMVELEKAGFTDPGALEKLGRASAKLTIDINREISQYPQRYFFP